MSKMIQDAREHINSHSIYKLIWVVLTGGTLLFAHFAIYPGSPTVPGWVWFNPLYYSWLLAEMVTTFFLPFLGEWTLLLAIIVVALMSMVYLIGCVILVRAIFSILSMLIEVALEMWEFEKYWIKPLLLRVLIGQLIIGACVVILQWIFSHPIITLALSIIIAALIIAAAIVLHAICSMHMPEQEMLPPEQQ